jgi:multidrug efflux pump subunit AcrA (membrane-fusion protein)
VRGTNRVIALCLVALALALSACGGSSETSAPVQPAEITKLAGGGVEITLTADAVRRIDVRTAEVERDGARLVIPYSAVLYDPDGATWAYINIKPRVFVRADITVDRIVGERAILTKGPPPGTAVVTLGATELWGVEYGGIQED